MVFIRYCFLTAVLALCCINAKAQTIYYPAKGSELLQATAADIGMLLQKAIPGSQFIVRSYISIPADGIIFVYDSMITDNQACRVQSNGSSYIKFSAAQDNGLHFGVYQYLHQAGFRFYQPGSIWEIIPSLSSVYTNIDSIFTCHFKYKNWFITGGHNRWAMDNDNTYPWDNYFGANGHQWALYQRRNGMTGGYRFTGHRDDIMSGTYLTSIQNNPCYVACYDNSRKATTQSVPDINNPAAVQLWGNAIDEKYSQFRNIIFGKPDLYANYYRNFNYNNQLIGLEVPDGAHWGNSKDAVGCGSVDYPKESDQQFTLANLTAQKLLTTHKDKRFQVYAYASHADVPSVTVPVDPSLDVQVVSTGFQFESSAKGLLNRWYSKTSNISEYHYLNLSQWGGETPTFYLKDLETTLQRLKEKNSQGIVWEASPSKFASLPFLLAANNNLKDNITIDSTLHEFCNTMFAGASGTIYKLLELWGDDKNVTVGDGTQDNKYKVPQYFSLLNIAVQQTQNGPAIIQERIRELKAYLHYMMLYYDWMFDQRTAEAKAGKAAALCIYLARINKLQIVNSYFLIADIVSRYPATSNLYVQYNVSNGTAYQNGNLPLITGAEIDIDFLADIHTNTGLVQQYILKDAKAIREQFTSNDLRPLKKIAVKIGYTNGENYPNRSEFYIDALTPGEISIHYVPHFNMPGKGYINFTVEDDGNALQVIKDFSIDNKAGSGTLHINLPAAGTYKFSVVSKYKSAVDLDITTNGNYFYRKGPFLGNTIENYRADLLSLPGYFYVPAGLNKIYFSINNSNPGGTGFAKATDISKAFIFKDNNGNIVEPYLVTFADSAFFYLDVPVGNNGSFWQVVKMEQYRLCFANISNMQWYAERNPCPKIDFTTRMIQKNNECITQLKAGTNWAANLQWKVYDGGQWYYYGNKSEVELPGYISPNAIVTLTDNTSCYITKRIGDDSSYLRQKENCASAAPVPVISSKLVIYPNPGPGIFNCMQNGAPITFDMITIYNSSGIKIADFMSANHFSISTHATGIYFYRMMIKGTMYTGKIARL